MAKDITVKPHIMQKLWIAIITPPVNAKVVCNALFSYLIFLNYRTH